MVAGLSSSSLAVTVHWSLGELAWRAHTHKDKLNLKHASCYNSRTFKAFLWALALAILGIFVRSVFRVAKLSKGFGGDLANNEVSFMVPDGTTVIISCLALTIIHPGVGFGTVWQEANFSFRTKKEGRHGIDLESNGNDGSEEGSKIEERKIGVKGVRA